MKKKIFLVILIMIMSSFLLDNVVAETYNNYTEATTSCGSDLMTIPTMIPKLVSFVYIIIQVAVPIVLVIMGSLDLLKGITAQKEEEIKKGRHVFIKRLIAAVLVFFVFVIVKLVISFVADGTGSRIMECAECFIENDCDKK